MLRLGDVVVLDNLTKHKQPEVPAAIERVGARSGFCALATLKAPL